MLQSWNATDQMDTVTKGIKIMKNLIIISLLILLSGNYCYASDMNSIFYGIRSGIDVLSDVNRLRGQVNQTNAQKQERENNQPAELPQTTQQPVQQNSYYDSQNTNNYYESSKNNEGTAFSAKSKFSQGNIYLKQGKYREAIDSYYEAKELFESIGDTENAQKAEQAYDEAIEMRCEFGDYCM